MTYDQIKDRVYFLSKTNSTSYPIADLTDSANAAVERVVSLINRCDSRWQFDDTNQTDLPVATTALVSGQADYTLATSHLSIDRVELKDASGTWSKLIPKDQHDTPDEALSATTSGIPTSYDLMGASVILDPVPNYSQAASLKIYFTRPPVSFLTTDDDEVPGFNPLFHDLVPLWVAYDYCLINDPDAARGIFTHIQFKEEELYKFYGLRSRDHAGGMRAALADNH